MRRASTSRREECSGSSVRLGDRVAGEARSEAGIALLMVVTSLALFLAVAATLVLMASIETRMAGAERARHAVSGAAEVALERALQELAIAADLNEILAGPSVVPVWPGRTWRHRSLDGADWIFPR